MIGAGAVGGTIGARLAQAGVPVALVARGAHGRAMAADGLLLRTPHGDARVRPPVWLSASEAEFGQPLRDLGRADKQRAVQRLDGLGAFVLRRSIEDVADALGVSRITVYNYLAHGS